MSHQKHKNQLPLPETAIDCEGTSLHFGDIVFVPQNKQNIRNIYRKDAPNPYSYSTRDFHYTPRDKKKGKDLFDKPQGIPSLENRPFVYIGDVDGCSYFAPLSHINTEPEPGEEHAYDLIKYDDFQQAHRKSKRAIKTRHSDIFPDKKPVSYFYGQRRPITYEDPFTPGFQEMLNQHPEKWQADLVTFWAIPLTPDRVLKLDCSNPKHFRRIWCNLDKKHLNKQIEFEKRMASQRESQQKVLLDRKDLFQQDLVNYVRASKRQFGKINKVLQDEQYQGNFNNLIAHTDREGVRTFHGTFYNRRPIPHMMDWNVLLFGGDQTKIQQSYRKDLQRYRQEQKDQQAARKKASVRKVAISPDDLKDMESQIKQARNETFEKKSKNRKEPQV